MSELVVSSKYTAIGALAVEVFRLPAMEGITRVSMEYSGSGDSGDIDQMSFFRMIDIEHTVIEDNEIAKIEIGCPDDLRSRLISYVQNDVRDYWGYCSHRSGGETGSAIKGFFQAILWQKLNQDYAGWENNDGASGYLAVVFDGTAGTVKIAGEHRSYFVDYETTETELVITENDCEAEGGGQAGGL
jgi:hypothetical protein